MTTKAAFKNRLRYRNRLLQDMTFEAVEVSLKKIYAYDIGRLRILSCIN